MHLSQRIYLESTVWYQMANYASSEFKNRAEELFGLIEEERYTVYVSNVVLEEIAHDAPKYRERVEELMRKYKPLVIMQHPDADDVAMAYMENAFARRKDHHCIVDAFHAAVAVTSNITYMATYNYRNLLNVRILEHINAVNLLAGLNRHLSVYPPFMFLDLDNYDGEKGTVHKAVWKAKSAYGKKLAALLEKKPEKRLKHHETVTTKAARNLGLEIIRLTDL
ncbi:MAG: PIN domain-containing protein [Chitinivibrionales bacterium]|nr:PIN domain-containing protein [Chitinivibrionales bacterium]